jgi:hypothetical protein
VAIRWFGQWLKTDQFRPQRGGDDPPDQPDSYPTVEKGLYRVHRFEKVGQVKRVGPRSEQKQAIRTPSQSESQGRGARASDKAEARNANKNQRPKPPHQGPDSGRLRTMGGGEIC